MTNFFSSRTPWLAPIFCIIVGAWTSACATFGDAGQGELVERSKVDTPKWVDVDSGQLNDQGKFFTYTQRSDKVKNLPFAIKEGQLTALAGAKVVLMKHLRQQLSAIATAENVTLTEGEQWNKLLNTAVDDFHAHYADVNDIYYEKFKLPQGEDGEAFYYRIFILVVYARERVRLFYMDFGQKLTRSRDGGLQKFGRLLLQKAGSGSVSH